MLHYNGIHGSIHHHVRVDGQFRVHQAGCDGVRAVQSVHYRTIAAVWLYACMPLCLSLCHGASVILLRVWLVNSLHCVHAGVPSYEMTHRYLSIGLRKEDQAKGVAVLGVLDILPAVFGGPFFTAVFFDPNSKQTRAFAFAGAIFLVISIIIGCGLPRDAEQLAVEDDETAVASGKKGVVETNVAAGAARQSEVGAAVAEDAHGSIPAAGGTMGAAGKTEGQT